MRMSDESLEVRPIWKDRPGRADEIKQRQYGFCFDIWLGRSQHLRLSDNFRMQCSRQILFQKVSEHR